MLWVDKYRSRTLDKMIVHDDIASSLKKLVSEQDCPHLLFYGPRGSGKKTLIMALLKQMFGPGAEKTENKAWMIDDDKINRSKGETPTSGFPNSSEPPKLVEGDHINSNHERTQTATHLATLVTLEPLHIINSDSQATQPAVQANAKLANSMPAHIGVPRSTQTNCTHLDNSTPIARNLIQEMKSKDLIVEEDGTQHNVLDYAGNLDSKLNDQLKASSLVFSDDLLSGSSNGLSTRVRRTRLSNNKKKRCRWKRIHSRAPIQLTDSPSTPVLRKRSMLEAMIPSSNHKLKRIRKGLASTMAEFHSPPATRVDELSIAMVDDVDNYDSISAEVAAQPRREPWKS